MNIGIIVYSQTGNTSLVAQDIKKELTALGHKVKIEKIETIEKESNNSHQIKRSPDIQKYEALIFGSPVQAFSLAVVMKNYLKQIPVLNNKKVVGFVTKRLPFNWTGGKQAIKQLKNLCESKNGNVCDTGIVKWRDKNREEDITILKRKICDIFKS